MSLVIEVKINSHVLKTVAAHRLGEKRRENTYSVVLYDHEAHTETSAGPITHRAGDGALVLARKALEKVEEMI